MQVTLFLSTAWRESHASHYDRVVPKQKYLRWVEAEMVSPESKGRNGEDFSYIEHMLPLVYQQMAVKKTSFPEMECNGSIVVSIPDVVEGLSPPNYVKYLPYVLCALNSSERSCYFYMASDTA
ncbi:hypothetical protein Tco_0682231 [Tanacetum coccineum]|uniref:Uncharacterized protein n=1 Tax=Tanacetum coccineum TaxID=301880 RepID=A0ABQ4XS41_9ASTR